MVTQVRWHRRCKVSNGNKWFASIQVQAKAVEAVASAVVESLVQRSTDSYIANGDGGAGIVFNNQMKFRLCRCGLRRWQTLVTHQWWLQVAQAEQAVAVQAVKLMGGGNGTQVQRRGSGGGGGERLLLTCGKIWCNAWRFRCCYNKI